MTAKVKKQQKSIREQLSELLNFRQIRDSFQQLGLTVGKDKTNSQSNINIKGGMDADELYLSEINRIIPGEVISGSGVFVYDTSKDSDGGAWRKRVAHTSWATESLGQAHRGNRSEFPAVAVIVAERRRLVIYDADHEDLSMWMSFEAVTAGNNILALAYDSQDLTAVYMLNGVLCVGQRRTDNVTDQGIWRINFISDHAEMILGAGAGNKHLSIYNGGISSRNSGNDYIQLDNRIELIKDVTRVRDIHMCVLPDAPIDPTTKLPVPTVAIASGVAASGKGWTGNVQGAVDVLRHDDTSVTLWNSGGYKELVRLFPDGAIMATGGGGIGFRSWALNTIPTTDSNGGDFAIGSNTDNWQNNVLLRQGNPGNTTLHNGGMAIDTKKQIMSFYEKGQTDDTGMSSGHFPYQYGGYLALHNIAYNNGFENFGRSLHNIVSDSFNTGWMCGDRRVATCCDCAPGTVGALEDFNLISNGDFADGLNDWELSNGKLSSFSVVDGVLNLVGDPVQGYDQLKQTIKTTPGKMYELSMDLNYLNNYPFVNLKDVNGDSIRNVQIHTSNGFTAGMMQRFSFCFMATTQETTLIIGGNSPYGDGATFDNIKIVETNNLVKNGRSFWTGNTANVIHDWYVANTGTLTRETDGRMRIDSTSYAGAYAYINNTTPGEQYHIRVQLDGGTDYSDFDVRIKDGAGGISSTQVAVEHVNTGGVVSELNMRFRASDTSMILHIIPGRGGVASGTSWVHLAEVRQAVNEYGLVGQSVLGSSASTNAFEIQGQIEKQRVNPNGDLCMHALYDNQNNLMVLRRPAFDWSNDWTISGWCPTGFGKVSVETADNTTLYNNTVFMVHIHDNMRNTRSRNSDTPNAYSVGSNFFAATYSRAEGVIKVYNHLGHVERIIDDNGNPFSSTDTANVWIGRSTYNGSTQSLQPGTYSMCLLKISQTELTAQEIRDTHDREYKLIHADAPVSLSDARTASSVRVAHDAHTGELHVKHPDSIDTYIDGVRIRSKPGAVGTGSRDSSNNVNPDQGFAAGNGVIVRT